MKTKSRTNRSSVDAAVVGGVTITHPDRIIFPEDGITKLDLAQYYELISDRLLPHIVNRPLTLVRCPQGRAKQCFYQKHLTDSFPEALHGIEIQEKEGKGIYVVVKDLAGLISLVQMGVIELHPWPATGKAIEKPDRLVFDLDPGPEVDWKQVIEAAFDVKELLEQFKLVSFVRTSGGKGLHVVVPLRRKLSWDITYQFAKAIAVELEERNPKRYTATMSKAKRKGKIYVDYLRNQRGATAVASYSVRARQGAAIVTPLTWNELSPKIKSDTFTMKNIQKRLKSLKTDPWKEFFELSQTLSLKNLAQK